MALVIIVVAALLLGWVATAMQPIWLRPVENPFVVALQTLGTLFVIALFVERAVQVFVASAWDSEREKVRAQLEQARTAVDVQLTATLGNQLIAIRDEVRRAAQIVSIALGVLVALGGVTLLSAIVDGSPNSPQPQGLQAIAFAAADIAITAGLIAGGSKVIHELMEVVTQGLSSFRPNPPDDQVASAAMAQATTSTSKSQSAAKR